MRGERAVNALDGRRRNGLVQQRDDLFNELGVLIRDDIVDGRMLTHDLDADATFAGER
jgi:hypothetical protein